jgi:integration host factor subunit beta
MTKSELIKRLKEKYETLYLKDVNLVVDVVLDCVSDALANGDRVELRGFGSFSSRERAPRTARNPKTGESVKLGARKAVYFRAGKELRDRMNDDA